MLARVAAGHSSFPKKRNSDEEEAAKAHVVRARGSVRCPRNPPTVIPLLSFSRAASFAVSRPTATSSSGPPSRSRKRRTASPTSAGWHSTMTLSKPRTSSAIAAWSSGRDRPRDRRSSPRCRASRAAPRADARAPRGSARGSRPSAIGASSVFFQRSHIMQRYGHSRFVRKIVATGTAPRRAAGSSSTKKPYGRRGIEVVLLRPARGDEPVAPGARRRDTRSSRGSREGLVRSARRYRASPYGSRRAWTALPPAPCWKRRFGKTGIVRPVTALTPRATISPFRA